MRTGKSNLFFTLQSIFLTVMLMLVTVVAHADSVKWRSYSADAFKAAKSSNRQVLLYGYSPHCQYCAMMNSKTMTDRSVIKKINSNYIPVKVNTLAEGRIAQQYHMNVVPTILILNSSGGVERSMYGYQDASELSGKL